LQASQEKIEKQNISLQHLVSEKEWLLKEIHHRVKNNLHTISGLLDTQSGYLQTEEALSAISDSQHRVQAMSLLHQKLFYSESLSVVEMWAYIHELVGYLEHSFGTQQTVRFNLDIDNLLLGLSHALPIGLILNEAITNAIKYAFPDKKAGTITVRLKQGSANQCFLLIADNGKGLPADFDSRQSHSMGMNLMRGLSEDMNGRFSIRQHEGTEITVSFVYDIASPDNFSFHSSSSSKQ
jgi:two-component sensor histidine kinase